MRGVESNQELDTRRITRDTRTMFDWFFQTVAKPKNFAYLCAGTAVATVAVPALAIPVALIGLPSWMIWRGTPQLLPIRYPKDLGGKDPSNLVPLKRKKSKSDKPDASTAPNSLVPGPAEGIQYLGLQKRGTTFEGMDEIWASDSDARTHMLVMGTTGSGKTENLLSIAFNSLAWGSGFFYSDGKADNSLFVKAWSLARRVGREDDVLVINFMTGGRDIQFGGATEGRYSNTFNPLSDGTGDFLVNMVSTLMPDSGGDSMIWKSKAINMLDAVIRSLCAMRAQKLILIDAGTLRDYMSLDSIIKMSNGRDKDGRPIDLGENQDLLLAPIRAYLKTGLPGYDEQKARDGKAQSQTTLDQHGFLTGQLSRTMGMLVETYGHIFKTKYPEVDMLDVVLRRRILIVMLPTMEKSEEEAANLGKLTVSALRLMMAMNLGSELEGYYEDTVGTKATASPYPFPVIMDELGYYFAKGIAIMFAQARGIGMQMIAAGQDIPAMAKGTNKEEVQSMIANTNIKQMMKLEDPAETFELASKIAGEAYVSHVSGFEGNFGISTSYNNMQNASIEKRSRITIQEMKAMDSGESIIFFKDKAIRSLVFYVFGRAEITKKIPVLINRFLPIEPPSIEDIADFCEKSEATATRENKLAAIMSAGRSVDYGVIATDMELRATETASALGASATPIQRGIALYLAAASLVDAMEDESAVMQSISTTVIPDSVGSDWKSVLQMPPLLFVGVSIGETGVEKNDKPERMEAGLAKEIAASSPPVESEYSMFDDIGGFGKATDEDGQAGWLGNAIGEDGNPTTENSNDGDKDKISAPIIQPATQEPEKAVRITFNPTIEKHLNDLSVSSGLPPEGVGETMEAINKALTYEPVPREVDEDELGGVFDDLESAVKR